MADVQELKARWDEALSRADAAVLRHPDAYADLKKLLDRVNRSPVDVSEYHRLACRLTELIETLREGGRWTVFDYFVEGIDPNKEGCARYFRFLCTDLQQRIDDLDTFRRARRGLSLVR